jgi:hypothetical protein
VRSANNESGTAPDDVIWSCRSVDIGEIVNGGGFQNGESVFPLRILVVLLWAGNSSPTPLPLGLLCCRLQGTETGLMAVACHDDDVQGQACINCKSILQKKTLPV